MATAAENLTLHRYPCTNQSHTQDLGDSVTLTLMLIPAGEFTMGAPADELDGEDNERPRHLVKVSAFLMGRYPVTQAQWRVVAGYEREAVDLDPDPSKFKGDDLPVEQVSCEQATEFCQRLSKRTGKHYHLPSEAQWEYACRAETTTAYHFGPQLTAELANYGRQVNQTTSVGNYPPNRWGLHDMHGNVWEWCADQWHGNYNDAPTDGSIWIEDDNSSRRVLRGGSWVGLPRLCRSAYRGNYGPDDRDSFLSFRVVCVAP
ncbi:formylglycine-generating enzyme family protein [Leptolyngbya sp. PCC 6406]|uniref:formylglycine-generating enzyme family protein n=1 Tax=Leptolyngbya sp. PCC 6406 TaxID=1173264 RepID=UPI0002ABA9AC|nr:formylglycine-generating enzyme family protein [Leptolyngbya sp. PCC 6406]